MKLNANLRDLPPDTNIFCISDYPVDLKQMIINAWFDYSEISDEYEHNIIFDVTNEQTVEIDNNDFAINAPDRFGVFTNPDEDSTHTYVEFNYNVSTRRLYCYINITRMQTQEVTHKDFSYCLNNYPAFEVFNNRVSKDINTLFSTKSQEGLALAVDCSKLQYVMQFMAQSNLFV